jgi:hypothetical protein
MASQAQSAAKESPKRATRRSNTGRSTRSRSNGRSRTRRRATTDVGELERVIRGLEDRLAQLTDAGNIRSTISGATGQVNRTVASVSDHLGDMVADTLTNVADHLRTGATSVTGAARIGTGAMQRIGSELERRPMMTIAIALGIGFLAGLAGRRDPNA